jgi:hypothetical protein
MSLDSKPESRVGYASFESKISQNSLGKWRKERNTEILRFAQNDDLKHGERQVALSRNGSLL